MNEKIKELELQIDRLKGIAIGLKVDLNIRDEKIRRLEHELTKARNQVRSLEIGTQTMRNLAILDDDDGSPYNNTGQHRSPWKKVR